MNTDSEKQINTDLLYQDLTYKIRGAIMTVANKYGKGLKEIIYQNALAEELTKLGLAFVREQRITIYSLDTGKALGYYSPDFIVEDKVIIETKSTDYTIRKNLEQQLSYLKASKYEVGLLTNFSSTPLYIKRLIYTNDRKPQFRVNL